MDKQFWFCLECNRCGVVEYEKHSGAYAVVTLIRDDHHQKSGRMDCSASPRVAGADFNAAVVGAS